MASKSMFLSSSITALRRHKTGNIIIVFFTIQIVAVVFALIFPEQFRYLDVMNIQVLLKDIPQVGVIALGVNLLMIAGEFDLSVGATFTFTALCMAKIFNAGANVWVAALIGIAIGAAIGWLNGYITVRSSVPSFIITLGSMMFWRGMILVLSQSVTERFAPGSLFEGIFTSHLGPIQVQFVWLVGLTVLTWFLLERHRLGNHFFAVGGNRMAAIALGINPNRVKIIAFVITGALAAFSGILSTVRVASVSPIQGEGFELQAIAASVIGGTALMGGQGSMIGAFLGAALLSTIQDFLLLLRAPGAYLKLFVGVIVVFAAILNQLLKKD